MMITLIALLGPILANEKPYYCTLEGKTYYPLFAGTTVAELSNAHPAHSPVDWQNTSFGAIWRAPVPYSYHTIDLETGGYRSPFSQQKASGNYRHWLGTDQLGRDVLSGMIRGCRVSLFVGLLSMIIAVLIGLPFGALSAWWGDHDLRVHTGRFLLLIVTSLLLILLLFAHVSFRAIIISTLFIMSVNVMAYFFWITKRSGRVRIPFDRIVIGLISIVDGFPALFLILVLVALLPVSGWLVITLVIALLRWPAMARYMRAEVFKIKETNYIKAARITNIPSGRILRQHIVPYALRPVMISFIFGISSAILAESSLSFLGIGLPTDELNWGRLLAQSRSQFEAWWLVLFPGLAIFLTLLSFYTIGNSFQQELRGETSK